MSMRKSVFMGVFILILLLVAASIPYFIGSSYKQHFFDLITTINQSNMRVKINVLEYHQGWLSSDAKLSVQAVNTAEPNTNEYGSVTVTQHIIHGPLLTDPVTNQFVFARAMLNSQIFLPEPINSFLTGQAGVSLFQMNTIANFDDSYTSHVSSPPMNTKTPDGGKISFKGITGTSRIDTKDNKINIIKSTLNIGEIAGTNAQGSFATKPIFVIYNVQRNAIDLWDGTYNLSLAGFNVNSIDNGNYSFKDFKIIDDFGMDSSQMYNNKLQISLGNVVATDMTVVNQANLNIAINKLNSQALANFLAWAYKVQTQDGHTQIQMSQFNDYAARIFTPATTITENILVNTVLGNFVSDGQVYWQGEIKTLDDVQNNANFKVNIRVAIALVDKIIDLSSPSQPTDLQGETVSQTEQTANTPPVDLDGLQKQIDAWSTQSLISASVGIQLKDIVKSKVASDVFAANMDQFVLRKDLPDTLASQLKVEYSSIVDKGKKPVAGMPGALTNMPPTPPKPVVQAAPQPAAPKSAADAKKQMIQDYLKQGYIKQDNNDYITTITRENGVIKVNGLNAPS